MGIDSLRNCPKCGKVFNYAKVHICPACQALEEEEFEKVRAYIKDNDQMNIAAISENTDVTVKKILRYIKEGRIEINSAMAGEVRCESCGCTISKGRYCDSCAGKMNEKVKAMFAAGDNKTQSVTEKKATIMHTQNLRH